MPPNTPLLLGYLPSKNALPVIEPDPSFAVPGSPGGKFLVVEEFWSLFSPVDFSAVEHSSWRPDVVRDWQMLVHGDEAQVQSFWEDVSTGGALETQLAGFVEEDLQLVDETSAALVLQWRSTRAHRQAAQNLFEAQYPELTFSFTWGVPKYIITSGYRSSPLSTASRR